MARKKPSGPSFAQQAEHALNVEIAHRVNALGGYGPAGEVIYEAHPFNCPSVMVDSLGPVTAEFMSNGSVDLSVKLPDGMEVRVLRRSFDRVEKREIGLPSANVWLDLGEGDGPAGRAVASLMNPAASLGLAPESIRIVKLGDPSRAIWYCATFSAGRAKVTTAVRLSLAAVAPGRARSKAAAVASMSREWASRTSADGGPMAKFRSKSQK